MTNKPNVTSKYEEERLRAAEQSQIVYLQGQIDELRRLIKEQTNKYNLAMEQVRRVEGNVSQVEGILERHRQEVAQVLDSSRRDIVNLRKEVASALIKAEESVKPIRDMQAQIQQLGEVRKQDRDQIATWLVRIEELEERTRSWQAQIRESEDRDRALWAKLDGLYSADDQVRDEVRKIYEDLQLEKQSLRRQSVEAQQLVADVRLVLDDHNSRISRLDEIRQQIELFAEQLPPQITVLDGKIVGIIDDLKRIERISTERFLMNQERLEEIRHHQDERLVVLQETDEQHMRQLTAWLERIDVLVRELEQRMNRSTARLEVAQRDQAAHIAVLEHRDIYVFDAMAATLRDQLERIKADQIERGIVSRDEAP